MLYVFRYRNWRNIQSILQSVAGDWRGHGDIFHTESGCQTGPSCRSYRHHVAEAEHAALASSQTNTRRQSESFSSTHRQVRTEIRSTQQTDRRVLGKPAADVLKLLSPLYPNPGSGLRALIPHLSITFLYHDRLKSHLLQAWTFALESAVNQPSFWPWAKCCPGCQMSFTTKTVGLKIGLWAGTLRICWPGWISVLTVSLINQ